MTDLGPYLERLGLEQYLDAFIGEGFDTWETLLDIQEGDFDALNVKLGHRRKLQRAIADYRGISYERLIGSPAQDVALEGSKSGEGPPSTTAGAPNASGSTGETKRKYRRHPKPDENAPFRPPSAYVIFSNKVREEVKRENLTFTQIAKLVGDKWQKLDPVGKEPYESQAKAAKERYNIEYSTYKKTDKCKEYMQYLAEFKTKHGGPTEQKRPKFEGESSGGSVSGKSLDMVPDFSSSMPRQVRGSSVGSVDSSTFSAPIPSPAGIHTPVLVTPINLSQAAVSTRLPALTSSRSGSPPPVTYSLEQHRRRAPISTRSSVSDESSVMRIEQSDPVTRTAALSLNTPPAGTSPFTALGQSGVHHEYGGSQDGQQRFNKSQHRGLSNLTEGGSSQVFVSSVPSMQALPSPATPDGPWRNHPLDVRGYQDPTRALPPLLQTYTSSPSPTSAMMPTLISPNRLYETTQSHPQRTLPLPLPRASSSSGSSPSLQHLTRGLDMPRASSREFQARRRDRLEGHTPASLGRSDSDRAAANALAGLASGGSRKASAHVTEPYRPR